MKVIIDYGNYNIKVFSKEKGTFQFSSKSHTNFEPNPEAFERVEFEGITTFIGVGDINQEFVKVNKESMQAQILYAVSKVTSDTNIELCVLLPINQLPQKKVVIDMFDLKTFRFKLNGKDKYLFFRKVCILPECAVSSELLPNKDGLNLIIDIGSRTTQIALYKDGHLTKNATEKLGVINLYEEIMNRANAAGGAYELEDIEDQIKRGTIKVDEAIYKSFMHQVLNKIKTKVTLSNSKVTFTGGGSLVLSDVISTIPNVEIMDNAVFTNVLGAYEVVKKVWGDGDKI